jgi:hypothetical protein
VGLSGALLALVEQDVSRTPYAPGRAAVLDVTVPSGTYALLDYIPDTTSGMPHAFGGMHAVVTVA